MATPEEQIRNRHQNADHDLLAIGPSLTLAQWLDVSWFYPEGFEKEQIVETPDAWVVLGNQFVYKFLKVTAANAAQSFQLRWQRACEELLDRQFLAADIYVGLRLLRFIDDEPNWVSETHASPHPLRPPPDADDVAIVLRRLPEENFLNRLLAVDRELASNRLLLLTRSLGAFHQKARKLATEEFLADPLALTSSLTNVYLARSREFLAQFGSYLDPFSKLAMQEVSSFIRTFLERHTAAFLARGHQGAVLDGHGKLRARDICFWKHENTPRVAIFGRLPRFGSGRFGDLLADVASLAIDLEAQGHTETAAEFESMYFGNYPEFSEPELYRFFKAAEATRSAEELLRSAEEEQAAQATCFLSLALKYSLNIQRPFLLVLSGEEADNCKDIARAIHELLPCKILGPENLATDGMVSRLPEEFQLERLLRIADTTLSLGSPVIIYWPLNQEEQRERIVNFAEKKQFPLRMIHAQCGIAEKLGRPIQSRQDGGIRTFTASGTPQRFPFELLEPSLPLPDLALAILRDLSRQA